MIFYILLFSVPVIIALGIIWIMVLIWLEERRWKKLGYRVEFVTPAVLRAEPDDFAVVFHENGKRVWFQGKIINKEYILSLDIPEGDGYNETDPQGINRKLMKERILSEISRYKIKIKQ
jgi:hypothetical protein